MIAAAARARLLSGGAEVLAVLPTRNGSGVGAYVCAAGRADEVRWVVLDEALQPLVDRRRIRDAVETAVVCEAAEESTGRLSADEAGVVLDRVVSLAEADEASLVAATEVQRALAGFERLDGVRVAEPTYLDRLAAANALLADRFDLLRDAAGAAAARLTGRPGEPGEALAEALWDAVRLLARDGAPDRFRDNVEGAMAAAAALADDVEAGYLVPLPEEDE